MSEDEGLTGESVSKGIGELLESHGYKIGNGSVDCTQWKLDHSNCVGCPYELGCSKQVRLMLLLLMPMAYEPKSFNDFLAMQQRITETKIK